MCIRKLISTPLFLGLAPAPPTFCLLRPTTDWQGGQKFWHRGGMRETTELASSLPFASDDDIPASDGTNAQRGGSDGTDRSPWKWATVVQRDENNGRGGSGRLRGGGGRVGGGVATGGAMAVMLGLGVLMGEILVCVSQGTLPKLPSNAALLPPGVFVRVSVRASVCVCVCVCARACTRHIPTRTDRMYVFTCRGHTHTRRHKKIPAHTYAHTCARTHTNISTHAHSQIHTYIHAQKHTTHAHANTTHTNTHTHAHANLHTHTCTRTRTHTHTHIHTHTHK